MAQPVDLVDWPAPVDVTETHVTFDLDGAVDLELFREAAVGNQVIASELSAQVEDLRDEADALVQAGQAQRRVAELRKEILEEERKQHAWEKAGLYLGIVLLIATAGVP